MTDAQIQRRLDDIYEGRAHLATGAERTVELIKILGPEGRRRVLRALAMCPRGAQGKVGE